MSYTPQQISLEVLNYWHTLSFLEQENYPFIKAAIKYKEEVKNRKPKQFYNVGFELKQEDDLYKKIVDAANILGMKKWGSINIYLGKVAREACIKTISTCLNAQDFERPERNTDTIALACLQLGFDGSYKEGSLAISPIMHLLKKIKNDHLSFQYALSRERLEEDIKTLEENVFEGIARFSNDEIPVINKKDKANKKKQVVEKLQEFVDESMTTRTIFMIVDKLKENYSNILNTNLADENNIIWQVDVVMNFYQDEELKNKKILDEQPLSLNMDFFSSDFEMLKKYGVENFDKDLLNYISCLKQSPSQRMDVIKPEDPVAYTKRLQDILNIKNAPLGKWPSRYMPAFMQQVAINMTINKGIPETEDFPSIFSVNGPPGTGKTTMLKEIIVSNIVDRAILLSEYTKPDDAFEKHEFDKKPDKTYFPEWYSLKDDRINDYSMLVTSCNNAAVENISKELPKSVMDDLDPSKIEDKDLKAKRQQVQDLYNIDVTGVEERILNKEEKPEKIFKDIYFTPYAQDLLNLSVENDDKVETAWALVTAALGKKSNINTFYHKALSPILFNFMTKTKRDNRGLESYKIARIAFKKQLELVQSMQQAMLSVEKIEGLINQINDKKQSIASCHSILSDLQQEIALNEQNILKCERCINEYQVEKDIKQASLNGEKAPLKRFIQLFSAKKKRAAQEVLHSLSQELAEISQSIERQKSKKQQYHTDLQQQDSKEKQHKLDIQKQEQKLVQLQNAVKEIQQKFGAELNQHNFDNEEKLYQRQNFNIDYVQNLVSEDNDISTKAHVMNPYFHEAYNCEREKLFNLALRFNKEFVLASKACSFNIHNLCHYWGLRERLPFSKKDLENIIPAFFQTLFLLVPVVSSTFAAVGRMLKDVKKPNVFGMLVVDEAGQAQPHMAIGSLFRCRKAIIVGDPKQIEPVVTDDMDLLKNAYESELLTPYKNKTISVQSFADSLNPLGTYFEQEEDKEWVGCPLVVHRRCIAPMSTISNILSYDNMMKLQTAEPKAEKLPYFYKGTSHFIDCKGKENKAKDHFVRDQADIAFNLLAEVFDNGKKLNPSKEYQPSIYIITPFTSVVRGMEKYLKDKVKNEQDPIQKQKNKEIQDYILDKKQKRLGTVHTFQGKEADEVIFLLGCDDSKASAGAIKWVNRNIVNVAVTRAKYRLYVICDKDAWAQSDCVTTMLEELVELKE